MKKLNEHGWGMMVFLVLLGLLFLTLLIVSYLANQFGDGLPSSRRGTTSYHYIDFETK